jgi:hypothetical protein
MRFAGIELLGVNSWWEAPRVEGESISIIRTGKYSFYPSVLTGIDLSAKIDPFVPFFGGFGACVLEGARSAAGS